MGTPDPDEREVRAGAVFEALADPTRRTVLRRVHEHGPVTATELADDLPVSRQAIAKHLTVLRAAGLVESRRAGRETQFVGNAEQLADTGRWLADVSAAWDRRLARLQQRARERASKGPAR